MAYVYKNLKQPKNTGSGIADYALLAPVYDFDADGIAVPTAPFSAPGDEVKVKTPHTFKTGRGFARFQLAPEKNQFDAKTVGDKGFNKLDQEATIFIPGSYAEAHETVKNLLNTPLIALIPDAECASGIFYQLGNDCVYAYLTADFSTGTTKDGVKGYNAKISYQGGSILLYTATVNELADA